MDPATAVTTSPALSLIGFAAVIFLLLFLIAKWKWHVFFRAANPHSSVRRLAWNSTQ